MKNVTSIKSDEEFIEQLNGVIHELSRVGSHEYFANKLIMLREITLKRSELKMPQEKYISLQRALDETGEFSRSPLGIRISEIVYYFAYNFDL